jgi:regulator of sigma E protease
MSIILQLIVALATLIILHEIGHFIAARLVKVDVEEFGIGFPPRILTLFELRGTKYSLNWLPLGGFVRLKGETNPDNLDEPGSLHAAGPWARLLIYFAGPLMNLMVGVLIYAIMFTQTGSPDFTKVIVVGISPDSPAEQAGLLEGDLITIAAGDSIDSTEKLRDTIYANLGEGIDISVLRGEENLEFILVPRENPPEGEGAIGIIMSNPVQPIGLLPALPMGAQATYSHSLLLATLPAQVMRGNVDADLARPVGYKGMYDIFQNVSERESPIPEASINLNVLQFFASITISLGAINLMPIPGLDGGRIIFTLPEIILRRRIPLRWQNAINMISITALIALFLYVNLLDFTNPIQIP